MQVAAGGFAWFGSRRDRRVALALGALAGLLYAFTLCRTVYWYDSAEYVTAAVTLGVPHPPGYPLYTLLAHVFAWLPFESPALAVNAMSALFAALAVSLSYGFSRSLGAGSVAACGGAALLASAPSFWLNATVAEVYAPATCCVFGVLYLLLRARAHAERRATWFAAALAGAGLGIHYSLASFGLGFAVLALTRARPTEPNALAPRSRPEIAALVAGCGGCALLAYACVFSYVLLRAGSDVVPNQAHPPSAARFLWLLGGGNYRLWFEHEDLPRHALVAARLLIEQCSLVGCLLAAFGAVVLVRRDRVLGLALVFCMLGNFGFFFRYRVTDLEVFLLPTVAVLCSLCALFADALGAALVRRFARRALGWVAAVLVLLVAAVRIVRGYPEHDLSAFTLAYDYGARVAVQLPYNTVILNYSTPDEWQRHAVFGMYFQHVLGEREDVKVVANADRPILDRLLSEGRPTYLYAPVAHVLREYEAVPEGDLFRLVRRR